ncbi:MAG: 3-hydroxyacyl-CoA dehydrogenase [Alphaproteobacteria bacterium]|nr:3-hydroxyacyl-CoA dehydrogenase [Alphaproteobacteria bacterium]
MALPPPTSVRRVTVLGAGTIGASWAAYFLSRGLDVVAWDPAPDGEAKVRAFVGRAWPALRDLGLAPGADQGRLRFSSDARAAVAEAAFVQESGPENEATKIALFCSLDDALGDDTVLASSTSGLLMSRLQAGRRGRERYVLGHPFNPPHLVPLVEVLGGAETDPQAVDWAVAFYNAIGKKAIKLTREVPGHVANRMQAALYREAAHLVASGVASAADVDTAIAYGPGLRWALLGPHLIAHLAGGGGGIRHFLDHIGPALEAWWADLGTPKLTPDVIDRIAASVEREAAGRSIENLEGERDRLLIALLRMLAAERGRGG